MRSSACLLRNNPADLPTVLQAKLIPFLNVFLALEECANQPKSEDMIPKNVGVYTVLPSVPTYLIPTVHRKSRQLPGSYSQLDLPVALWWLYWRMALLGFVMEVYLKA